MTQFDVAIVGLGAMGSASAHALAARGARVIAFDQFAPPHTAGSSHGHTRIIREAYYEHPLYVPLVQRAYELWGQLEGSSSVPLMRRTGGIMVGSENGQLFRGALESARTHGIDHEVLDAATLAERYPAYRPREDWLALVERRAGVLFPERCIAACLAAARRCGAELRTDERVRRWTWSARAVAIDTMNASYTADRLVVAAGPWLPNFIDSLGVVLPLDIERQLSHWFAPTTADARYDPERCPVGLWESAGELFATFPDLGHGIKCGTHHEGASTTPDSVDRRVSDAENEAARRLLNDVMPGAGGALVESRVCLYTNTPDHHFIIDWLEGGRVLVVSACSGHGFKFASAIGEIVAQLALDGRSWIDLKPFSLSRFR